MILKPILLLLFVARTVFTGLFASPGIFQLWLFSKGPYCRRHAVPYGKDSMRQTLDVFASPQEVSAAISSQKRCPKRTVVIYFLPGGWILHTKFFGYGLARCLTSLANVVVVVADYRPYPLANIPQQIRDVEEAILWTQENIEAVANGDPNQIVIVGESAGGFLAWNLLYRSACLPSRSNANAQEIDETSNSMDQEEVDSNRFDQEDNNCNSIEHIDNDNDLRRFNADGIKGFVGVAVPFDMKTTFACFAKAGLGKAFVKDRLFAKKADDYDPLGLVLRYNRMHQKHADSLKDEDDAGRCRDDLPPMHLVCGTRDATVPLQSTAAFFKQVQTSCLFKNCQLVRWQGATHLYQMYAHIGGDYSLSHHVLACLNEWTTTTASDQDNHGVLAVHGNDRDRMQRFEPVKTSSIGKSCNHESEIYATFLAESKPLCPLILRRLSDFVAPL